MLGSTLATTTTANTYNNYYSSGQLHADEALRKGQRDAALLTAASSGHTPRVAYLLRLGSDVDHSDEHGYTALHHAALRGFKDTVETLVQGGANVEAQSTNCGMPLHLAASRGHIEVLRYLLDCRANPEAQSKLVGRPLHCACFSGSVECTNALLAAGADATSKALVESKTLGEVSKGSSSLLLWNFYECEPLLCAFLCNHVHLFDVLLEAGASINGRCNWHRSQDIAQIEPSPADEKFPGEDLTLLHLAAATSKPLLVNKLLSQGAHVNASASNGRTPLLWAVWQGSDECVERLLQAGAKIETADHEGRNALTEAIGFNHITISRRLAQHLFSLRPPPSSESLEMALRYAIRKRRRDILKLLLETEAFHDFRNREPEKTSYLLPMASRLAARDTINRAAYEEICKLLNDATGAG